MKKVACTIQNYIYIRDSFLSILCLLLLPCLFLLFISPYMPTCLRLVVAIPVG